MELEVQEAFILTFVLLILLIATAAIIGVVVSQKAQHPPMMTRLPSITRHKYYPFLMNHNLLIVMEVLEPAFRVF